MELVPRIEASLERDRGRRVVRGRQALLGGLLPAANLARFASKHVDAAARPGDVARWRNQESALDARSPICLAGAHRHARSDRRSTLRQRLSGV